MSVSDGYFQASKKVFNFSPPSFWVVGRLHFFVFFLFFCFVRSSFFFWSLPFGLLVSGFCVLRASLLCSSFFLRYCCFSSSSSFSSSFSLLGNHQFSILPSSLLLYLPCPFLSSKNKFFIPVLPSLFPSSFISSLPSFPTLPTIKHPLTLPDHHIPCTLALRALVIRSENLIFQLPGHQGSQTLAPEALKFLKGLREGEREGGREGGRGENLDFSIDQASR